MSTADVFFFGWLFGIAWAAMFAFFFLDLRAGKNLAKSTKIKVDENDGWPNDGYKII